MKKYNKFKKRKRYNSYILFFIVLFAICVMSVGYAMSTETIYIHGSSNAKYEIYDITYELNGGTNPDNALSEFIMIDDIPFPIPTREGYTFNGWYLNNDLSGNQVTTTKGFQESITLYAKWKKKLNQGEVYNAPGVYTFDGTNYLTTDVYLYSVENVNKNFIISFNIESVSTANVNHSALMNSMNESGSPWPGHVVKISTARGRKEVRFESNSNTSGTGDMFISDSARNIRILRINNYLYLSIDGAEFVRLNDYNGFTDTFDIPVTFGASIDGKGNPYRFFTGSLSDLYIAFLDNDATVDDFNPEKQELKVAYKHEGEYAFNGTSDYIDTGLQLFSEENFNKDFEISFDVISIDPNNDNQATMVNGKNERINSYPGFVYRAYKADQTVRFEAKAGTGSGAKNKQSEIKKVVISRIDSVMYLSINEGEKKQVYDYTNFSSYFDVPITIGASLNNKGQPFRFFKGTLSNIVIKVEE